MSNPVEAWKAQKHGLDVWPDVVRYADANTPMKDIDTPDLERMKWYGFFYRKRDAPGRYMNRIRITANEMTAEQAREIAYIAYEYGHGIVDITTRANVQVQGLEITHVPKVAERLAAVGLTSKQTGHDNIRNVFGHPFSGLMPGELVDTRPLCREVTAIFVGSREYSDLPRKFNICLNGSEHHSVHFWTQDISYLACRLEDEVLFHVLIGGTQGQNPHLAWHLSVLVRPDQVVDVTRAILDLFRTQGSREKRNEARLRYLLERIGITGVLEYLSAHLPFELRRSVREPSPAAQYDDLVGWFPQRHPDLWTMGLCVPLGRLSWNQLEALAVLSKKWGDGQLRTTHEQGMAVINIPAGFRDAAATDAAAVGLSVHADTLARNTVACTGNQFCNIAVTETKGHMFQLIDKLRQRSLALHGIRVHMSGCPSSCAQHFTADIGLKGVRVRRLLGTREAFDVLLGGGVAGQVHMGIPYKLGVDVDQLPLLIEEVTNEYYMKHRPGQTFSAYWRERLRETKATTADEEEYKPATWICERCQYRHVGEDPPVFCPGCAGLRRFFARVEPQGTSPTAGDPSAPSAPTRDDGFFFAAKEDALREGQGRTVEVAGRDYALFRINGKVYALDSACPHEGGPLGQGDVQHGVVTCPWHGWRFSACTGCSIEPAGNDVRSHQTLVESGNIFIKLQTSPDTSTVAPAIRARSRSVRPAVVPLQVLEVIQETPDVRTFRLDNSQRHIPHDYAGKFAKVCVPIGDREVWRSFTISSSPKESRFLDLTIKRNPAGEVSKYLFDAVGAGSLITLKGPQGGFYFDPERHKEPLVLISAGSGITPMMSIARFLKATGNSLPCTFVYGARSEADVIFYDECRRFAEAMPRFGYHVSLSRPSDGWEGFRGRLDFERVAGLVPDIHGSRYFLCGPHDFMRVIQASLEKAGVQPDRMHTEQFHSEAAPQPPSDGPMGQDGAPSLLAPGS